MQRSLFQHFWLPLYRRWALKYIQQERSFNGFGLQLVIPPGVFHPGIFFSSEIFISFLQHIDFQDKKGLDIGTGSGILAIFCAQKGACATALDINPLAVKTALLNASKNGVSLQVFESDLFDCLPRQCFDFVLINPPYYPRRARDLAEHAFFAGENLEYFEKLFVQLPQYIFTMQEPGNHTQKETRVWIILSEDCDFLKMQAISARNGFLLKPVYEKKKWGERFFVAQADQIR